MRHSGESFTDRHSSPQPWCSCVACTRGRAARPSPSRPRARARAPSVRQPKAAAAHVGERVARCTSVNGRSPGRPRSDSWSGERCALEERRGLHATTVLAEPLCGSRMRSSVLLMTGAPSSIIAPTLVASAGSTSATHTTLQRAARSSNTSNEALWCRSRSLEPSKRAAARCRPRDDARLALHEHSLTNPARPDDALHPHPAARPTSAAEASTSISLRTVAIGARYRDAGVRTWIFLRRRLLHRSARQQ